MAAPTRPAPAATSAVASPCISLCRMHAATGWCEGCLRTLDEIATWGRLPDDGRREVLARLPARRLLWQARRTPSAADGTGPAGGAA